MRIFILFLLVWPAQAAAVEFEGPARGQVERVVDGDTVKMRVAIWLDQEILVSVRLAGVDAPELFRPKCEGERKLAREAKSFVESFLRDGEAMLDNIKQDKFAGRVVARLHVRGRDLGQALIAEGLGVKGRKGDWCAGA